MRDRPLRSRKAEQRSGRRVIGRLPRAGGASTDREGTRTRVPGRLPAPEDGFVSGQGPQRYVFDVLRSDEELRGIEAEWLELFGRSLTRNPFAHPAWVTSWLRHFVGDERRRLVLTARSGGELMGVAPFYKRTYRLGPIRAQCLQIAGGSPRPEDPLTEMSEILVARERWRTTMRALVQHVIVGNIGSYDWIGLTMTPEQGWFDDEWVPEAWQRRGAFAAHKGIRPFVLLPLPASWEELALKRNLKEAIRRSKNRLAALDGSSEVVFAEGEAVPEAVRRVQALHRRRAAMRDHLPHSDYFDDEAYARFARDASAGLAATGHASVALCHVDANPVAGRVVLRAHGDVFLSFSGVDPAYWHLGAATALIVASIREAISRRERTLNLSLNPDPAKLRWSNQLEFHNEFLVVAPSRRARAALQLFWQVRAGKSLAGRRQVIKQRGRS